jgi:glycosyltransferase involved in cell wall biosynthesis
MRVLVVEQVQSDTGGAEAYGADVCILLSQTGHVPYRLFLGPEVARPGADPGRCPVAVHQYADGHELSGSSYALEDAVEQIAPDVIYLQIVYNPTLIEWFADRGPTVAYVHGPYVVCPGSAMYLRRSARVCTRAVGLGCWWNAQIERCCWGRNPVSHWRALQRTYAFRRAYHRVSRILVGSHYMRDLLVGVNNFKTPVSVLAPVMLNISHNLPYRQPSSSYKLLYAGRLVPEKGLAHLLRALANIRVPWHLVVAGDGEARDPCLALARRLGFADRVEFVGWLNPQMLADMYDECAFTVVPSLWPEPFGRVGPESFAHGRPVIAFAVGGIPEWLEDGRTGLLVKPGSVHGLANAIKQMLTDVDSCRRMGQECLRVAKQRFTAQSHMERLLGEFTACIQSTYNQNADCVQS